MITSDDVKRLSFDVADEFEELDTQEKVQKEAEHQYEILDKDWMNPSVIEKIKSRSSSDYMSSEFETDKIQSSEIRDIINSSFGELGGKHNLSVSFKDFTEIASHIGEYSEKDSEFAKLYVSKMINAVSDVARTKATISLGFLTDRALTLAMERAKDPNIQDLGEIVAVIREIYDWLDKLQNLRDKYNIVGSDKLLEQMSEENKKSQKERLSDGALQDLVAQINANAKKAREEKE